jgi:hypothetical protein
LILYLNFRKKDGKKIETSDHMIIENDSVNEIFKLYLKNVHLEDEGTYTISAVNSVGEASADAKLHIHSMKIIEYYEIYFF